MGNLRKMIVDIKRKELIMVTVAFLLGAGMMLIYHLWQTDQQNRQIAHLISTSRELFNLQKSINLADSEAYNVVTDCSFNVTNCDQKAGAEKLAKLKDGRDLMTAQIDKLSKDIEAIIKANNWN